MIASLLSICIIRRGLAWTRLSLPQERYKEDYAEYYAQSAHNYVANRQEVVCPTEHVRR